MVNGYKIDTHPKANFTKEVFAVVHIPRIKRDRVPASNVEVMDSIEEAIKSAKNREHYYAAKVVGPARSSEGVVLFYIIDLYQ